MRNLGFACCLALLCACAEQRTGSEPAGQAPRAPSGPGAPADPVSAGPNPDSEWSSAMDASIGVQVGSGTSPGAQSGGGSAASTSGSHGGGTASSVGPDGMPELRPRMPIPDGLVVHEWGTFTSVSASTGALLEGLHHEEEALPSFVYGRDSVEGPAPDAGAKAMEVLPSGVTQKLETPVLYFYGAARKNLRVRVDFPAGVVSQWFPRASKFGPELGTVTIPRAGFTEWQFDLTPEVSSLDFPEVSPDDIWAPSRRVAAVPISVGAERERFIFYRGLGAFQLPLTTRVDASDRISIENHSTAESPAIFLLRVHPGGGAIVELGALPGGKVLSNVPSPVGGKEHDLDRYVADAQTKIAAALERTGLYPDEARAMVETWSKSYFKSEGLRLLYVVPRDWTDNLLPLKIEPVPSQVVRTLVGRVELLAPSEERELLARVSDAAARAAPVTSVLSGMGRLAEPKLRRVLELAADERVRTWTSQAITTAVSMP